MTFTAPQFEPVLADRLAPWLTTAADPYGDHANLLSALASMAQPFYGLVMDSGDDPDDPSWVPGWGALFDPDDCPTAYLPFLAQLVGVTIPPGSDDATARQLIRAEQGFARGTGWAGSYTSATFGVQGVPGGGAIVQAAQRHLTGTQSVFLQERTAADGIAADAYHEVVTVLAIEVIDADQLVAAVNAVKPGGIQWTLVQARSWTITELEGAGYSDLTAMEAAFSSIGDLEGDVT